MTKINSEVTINKSVKEVFEYTASPVNEPSFIPNLNENTNIHLEKPYLGQTFN